MKKGSLILNGFRNYNNNVQEVQKGVLNPAKLDNNKYAIFSEAQIKNYLKSIVAKNEGIALEIQKSVLMNVKEEIKHLFPVSIIHNSKPKKFYVAKADSCIELIKAVEPVNKKEGYFDSKINEDDVLDFINNNEEVDDDMLIKEFGKDVTEILNSLEEDGKLDVDEDGFYFVTSESDTEEKEGTEEENAEEEESAEEEEGTEEENTEEENIENESNEGTEEEEENIEKDDNTEGTEEGEDIDKNSNEDVNSEEDTEREGTENELNEDTEENNSAGGGTEEINFEENNENNTPEEGTEEFNNEGTEENIENNESTEEENIEEGEENTEGVEGNQDIKNEGMEEGTEEETSPNFNMNNNGNNETNNMTPEELEAFAKKTATVTLLKFYKNSTDEKLKEIAAVELKSRGIDVDTEGSNANNGNKTNNEGDLPENKAALDALEKFTKDYLDKYDNEDLISVVVELANQDPGKRKELKDLYRNYYSMNNNGNKLLKVDEDDFKEFLTDKYFNNFTPGDLQSYAYLLISKNPKEYRKYKKMMDSYNEPVV